MGTAFVAGSAMAAHGTFMAGRAVSNLTSQNGERNNLTNS